MHIKAFDHVNVLTANLAAMVDWYGRILDMKVGPRPPFTDDGAWLYLGDHPFVHLVSVTEHQAAIHPRIEHFAFAADNLAGFRKRLSENNVECTEAIVPGFGILQLNIHDPDGNHIHVDFDLAVESSD